MSKKKIAFLSISVALLLSFVGGAVFGQAAQKNNVYRYLSIFEEVFDLVRSNYVEPVSSDQLIDGAFSGVTDAIDEFSFYVPPAQMAAYKAAAENKDADPLGLVVTKRYGYAFVISAIDGSPASAAGIERGDFLEKIDGKATQKMAVWQIRNALKTGSPVHLQVLRGGTTKRDEFTVAPAKFHPVPLVTKNYGAIAYIKVPYFDNGTSAQLRAALDKVRAAGTRKLILDVRGNADGDVHEAIQSADELLTSGLITSLEGRTVEPQKWQADRATAYDGDLEVLTDVSTASAGEVFAGAIKGNSRGKTVGTTTYGRALVQKLIPLSTGGAVYMTVGHYTTPDLKPVKDQGLKPDVNVDLTSQALRDPNAKEPSKQQREDLILEKALQLFGADAAMVKSAA